MRRDLVYFYPAPMKLVYDAFYNAANQRFGKDCKADPFKTLQFGLNYSFKYNMNGGSITAHFMPYQNGIAVNLRYTIIQAFGARYQKHAQDYTAYVDGLLNVKGALIQLPVEQFLDYESRTPSGVLPQQMQQPRTHCVYKEKKALRQAWDTSASLRCYSAPSAYPALDRIPHGQSHYLHASLLRRHRFWIREGG